MSDIKINQKLIVPLFNVNVEKLLQLTLSNEEFVEQLNFYLLPEPIKIVSHGIKTKMGKIEPIQTPVPTPIPTPKTTIHIFPWGRDQTTKEDLNKLFPVEQLPSDFDVFDSLGSIAFRAGSGGLGGFQTVTTAFTKQQAKALLIIEFDQAYPEKTQELLLGDRNPYEYSIIDSFLDGLRLSTGNEPHQYKGFHVTNNQFVNSVIKWPLMEIQGTPIKLASIDIENVKNVFLQTWKIRANSRKSKSCKILNIAIEYYYLSSTMTETRTIFLHLMIAFESLYKTKEEESASTACSRLAKSLATTKEQYNEIRRFMWNTNTNPGCCQIRNQIVHGNTFSLSNAMYWKLRGLIRSAILKVMDLVLSYQIDREQYYESLNEYVGKRFKGLPNN